MAFSRVCPLRKDVSVIIDTVVCSLCAGWRTDREGWEETKVYFFDAFFWRCESSTSSKFIVSGNYYFTRLSRPKLPACLLAFRLTQTQQQKHKRCLFRSSSGYYKFHLQMESILMLFCQLELPVCEATHIRFITYPAHWPGLQGVPLHHQRRVTPFAPRSKSSSETETFVPHTWSSRATAHCSLLFCLPGNAPLIHPGLGWYCRDISEEILLLVVACHLGKAEQDRQKTTQIPKMKWGGGKSRHGRVRTETCKMLSE